MLFAGGPATEGPGMVVSNELKEPIRSHHDIDRDSVKHFKRATKVSLCLFSSIAWLIVIVQFYEALAKRASNNGHAIDLFAGCLDQVGLLEMKSLPNSTNGVIVLSDSFATSIFKQSFLRLFNKDEQGHLQMGFNATFDVQVRFLLAHGSKLSIKSFIIDNQRTESIGAHWSRDFRWKEICMCRRNRDRYRPDFCMEN